MVDFNHLTSPAKASSSETARSLSDVPNAPGNVASASSTVARTIWRTWASSIWPPAGSGAGADAMLEVSSDRGVSALLACSNRARADRRATATAVSFDPWLRANSRVDVAGRPALSSAAASRAMCSAAGVDESGGGSLEATLSASPSVSHRKDAMRGRMYSCVTFVPYGLWKYRMVPKFGSAVLSRRENRGTIPLRMPFSTLVVT